MEDSISSAPVKPPYKHSLARRGKSSACLSKDFFCYYSLGLLELPAAEGEPPPELLGGDASRGVVLLGDHHHGVDELLQQRATPLCVARIDLMREEKMHKGDVLLLGQ